MKKKIKIFEFNRRLPFHAHMSFIRSIPGAILPNIYGLAIAELTGNLPKGKSIYAFDNLENLLDKENGSYYYVPKYYLDLDTEADCIAEGNDIDKAIFRDCAVWFPGKSTWNDEMYATGCLLIFCD